MAKFKECVDEALANLKNFGSEELNDYIDNVFKKVEQYKAEGSPGAFERAIKEINDARLQSYFEDTAIKANNNLKYSKLTEAMAKTGVNIRSLLIKRNKNLGYNVAVAQKAAVNKLDKFFFNDLTHDEMEYLSRKENELKIGQSYDGKKIDDPFAKKLGKKVKDYFEYRNSQSILSNALKFEEVNDDRMFRQIHNASRMISGGKSLINMAKDRIKKKLNVTEAKTLWKMFIKKLLNLKGTFEKTKGVNADGSLNHEEIDKILDRAFDNITTHKSTIFTRSSVVNDREAIKRRAHMFFKFKDMQSFLEYNDKYGQGDLISAIMKDIQTSGNKIGTAEILGDSPYNMYNDLRAKQFQDRTDKMTPIWFEHTDLYFKTVMGLDKTAIDPNIANFTRNLRTWTSMVRLPIIAVQSLSDIGYGAAFAQRMGINYFEAWTNQLKHVFDAYPTEERQYIAKLFKTMVHSEMGYLGNYSDAISSNDVMSKISTNFFRKVGLEAFDRGNKVGIMHLMAEHLYNSKDVKFDALQENLQRWVGKFLNPEEWELLRQNNVNKLFTTENADTLTDEQLRAYADKWGVDGTLNDIRNDLSRKVFGMFNVASENAVLSPTEFERAWCLRGTQPGTYGGEALRMVMQFKMYTVGFIDRVLIQGLQDNPTGQQKLYWALSMMVGTLPLAVLSNFLSDILMNKVDNPVAQFNQGTVPQKMKQVLTTMAPSLSIFAGLLDPNNQNSSMVWSLIASPSLRLIGNTMGSAFALATGDTKKAGKLFSDAANYMAPIQTTPIVSPILQSALGQKAYLQPGQTPLVGG